MTTGTAVTLALDIAALILSILAVAMASGVSLGRQGDREDEYHYRDQVAEALNQLHERVRRVEPDDPLKPEDSHE
jgi:hypothetical protein